MLPWNLGLGDGPMAAPESEHRLVTGDGEPLYPAFICPIIVKPQSQSKTKLKPLKESFPLLN